MMHYPPGSIEHPVSAHDVKSTFRHLVSGCSTAETGTLRQYIVRLPAYGQLALEKIPADGCVPPYTGILLIRWVQFLPPVVKDRGIDLKVSQQEDCCLGIVHLCPVICRDGIDGTAGIDIGEIGADLKIILIGQKSAQADASAQIVIVIPVEILIDIIHYTAIRHITVSSQVQIY